MRRSRHITPAVRTSDVRDDAPTPADVLRYLVHLPDDYDSDPGRLWPLVLFLHGAGERGSDLDLAAVHGPPRLADDGHEFPFVLVTPQCGESSQWVAELSTLSGLVDEVVSTHRVDPARISGDRAQHGRLRDLEPGGALSRSVRRDRTDLRWALDAEC